MNKTFYYWGIFFIGLTTAAGLFQNVLRFQLGDEITRLGAFLPWLLIYAVNATLATCFILKYYHARHYKVALVTGTVGMLAGVTYLLVSYGMIVSPAQFVPFAKPTFLIAFAMSIIAGSSLVFSATRKNVWLLTIGLLIVSLGLLMGAAMEWYNSTQDVPLRGTLRHITQWLSVLHDQVPLLYIFIFWKERKALTTANSERQPAKVLETVLPFAGMLTFIITFIFCVTLARETHETLAWKQQLDIQGKEWNTLFESRTFVGAHGDTLHYQLLPPVDADPEKKYPLVVCLPYNTDVRGCPPAQVLLKDSNRKKYPAFLFVPYCQEGSGWGGVPNYPTVDTLVFDAILVLEAGQPNIDATRRYVTGVSRGGYGTWHFICTRPDMFAAAIPVCGGENPKLAANSIDVSVWAFHGANDKNVLVQQSRDLISEIKKAGGHPRYTEFPDAGHNIWDQVNRTPGLWDWLFEQKRDSLLQSNQAHM